MAHRNQFVSSWTDERVRLLKMWWADGDSAGTIAKRFDTIAKRFDKTTRNAIIGKIHRLGLARHPQPLGTKRLPRITNPLGNKAGRISPKHRTFNPNRAVFKARPPNKLKALPVEIGPPEAKMITLLQLTEHTCKYSLGEATGAAQLFCGAPKDVTDSWCPYHHRIVFLPARGFMEKRFGDLVEKVAA